MADACVLRDAFTKDQQDKRCMHKWRKPTGLATTASYIQMRRSPHDHGCALHMTVDTPPEVHSGDASRENRPYRNHAQQTIPPARSQHKDRRPARQAASGKPEICRRRLHNLRNRRK